jgi:guanine deaminase
MISDREAMEEALAEARKAAEAGEVPVGAVAVIDGAIVARGQNRVLLDNDPTAHAEIVAIREACRVLGDFHLSGCDVFSSCEPCPMCLGALYWARPARVLFAATHDDAAAAGFDDSFIYGQIALPPSERSIPMFRIADERATRPFEEWMSKPDRDLY